MLLASIAGSSPDAKHLRDWGKNSAMLVADIADYRSVMSLLSQNRRAHGVVVMHMGSQLSFSE
jgi:hypothetical protein